MRKRWHINFYALRTCIILTFTYAAVCVCVCAEYVCVGNICHKLPEVALNFACCFLPEPSSTLPPASTPCELPPL